jgi:hypothetical protein
MKEQILKILLENTETEGRYIGGGDEPIIIVFKDSEDCNRESYLSNITDQIVNSLDNKKMETAIKILLTNIELLGTKQNKEYTISKQDINTLKDALK